ncbi:unnamed protein product [Blepharisma stoltei]|uniref:Uncharacterized protein n=1 Tax=Blepharisma stoltei TaxID=1481888 RepID=A0AAU9KAG4_9CILI|nr:unnamed protein product [Blepharisma stoltei]
MEELDVNKLEDEMDAFIKLKVKLDKVKKYREHNSKRLDELKKEMKRIREHMDDVNKQQNLAIHKVITGRRKG